MAWKKPADVNLRGFLTVEAEVGLGHSMSQRSTVYEVEVERDRTDREDVDNYNVADRLYALKSKASGDCIVT